MARRRSNIVRFRRPFQLNVGVIIFMVVFLYMAIFVIQYMGREKIRVYEVSAGKVANTSLYTGFIVRDEVITTASSAGYINFYRREEDRVSVGTLVYTLDESGSLNNLLTEMSDTEAALSSDSLLKLKSQLVSFSTGYSNLDFSEVYSVKAALNTSLLEYLNSSVLDELTQNLSSNNVIFSKNYADTSGILEFYTDGYENASSSDICADVFKTGSYQKNIITSGSLVETGAPVYKTIHTDEWDVYVPISDSDKERFSQDSIISVTFTGTSLTCNAEYSLIIGSDGEAYAKLHFYKYMVRFASERYVSVELEADNTSGLKIPVSSVITRSFYVIPAAYLTEGGDSQEKGFLLESYSAEGTSTEFVTPTIYYYDGENYYVDTSAFAENSYLARNDSTERYPIGTTAPLKGVYNVNKGYAVFKYVNILTESDDYYIVEKGASYSISLYDNIVLNPEVVENGDIIY